MASLNKVVLEVDADADDDGTTENGVFEMIGNVTTTEQIEKSYILNNSFTRLNSILSGVSDSADANLKRSGIFFDLGAGSHIHEVQFLEWEGSNLQWGDGSSSAGSVNASDATGGDALQQMQVLMRYLRFSTQDSFDPALLHVGEYSDGTYGSNGLYDPIPVTITGPRNTKTAEDYSYFTGTFTAVRVADANQAVDSFVKEKF